LNTTFEELVSSVNTSQEAVAFFLALLEAVRWGFIKAEQTNTNKDIIIEKNYE
jgi:chromatin segregation and condensation protein Rec8/ScpA/Scc1 (kleisin family)